MTGIVRRGDVGNFLTLTAAPLAHMDAPPLTLPELARLVQQVADATDVGNTGAELRIHHADGSETVIRGRRDGAATLTERQRDIEQALIEAGAGARIPGPALAKLAGYECDSHFREDLSKLRKMGRIISHNPGYSVPG